MDYQLLKTELTTDPLTRGYAAMTDEEVAASLNDTVDRTISRDSITGDEVFASTDGTEFAALATEKQQLWMAFCGRDSIDPFGTSNVDFVTWVFGAGSVTLTALSAIRTSTVSRATELGFGNIRAGDIEYTRSI